MKPWSILFFIILGLALLATIMIVSNMPTRVEAQPTFSGARTPVIVELFTSEGCSSCPSADKVLAELEKSQPVANAQIIALGEHVDYWNYLGWSDPFSAAIFSERQQEYAHALNANTYTPQMVIDGQAEFVGSNQSKALDAIARAAREPKAKLAITKSNADKIKITVTDIPKLSAPEKTNIVLAITENNLSTNVGRGENAGRKLMHGTVVRRLAVIGVSDTAEATITLEKNWRRENIRLVAFLQAQDSRRILGATTTDFSDR